MACLWCSDEEFRGFSFQVFESLCEDSTDGDSKDELWEQLVPDLCYCFECVKVYHKIKDRFLQRRRNKSYEKILYKLEVQRLLDQINKLIDGAAVTTTEKDDKIDSTDDSISICEATELLSVPLLEILQYPYLMFHSNLFDLFKKGLLLCLTNGDSMNLSEYFPGSYFLLFCPDEQIAGWSKRSIQCVGRSQVKPSQVVDSVIPSILNIPLKNLFSGEADADEVGVIPIVGIKPEDMPPKHIFAPLHLNTLFRGLETIISSLSGNELRELLFKSENSQLIEFIFNTIDDDQGTDEVFWLALLALQSTLLKLGSTFWILAGSGIGPSRFIESITKNSTMIRKIEIMEREALNESAFSGEAERDAICSSKLPLVDFQKDKISELKPTGRTTNVFSWVYPIVFSFLDLDIASEVLNEICCHITDRFDNVKKPEKLSLLEAHAFSALGSILHQLVDVDAFHVFSEASRTWISSFILMIRRCNYATASTSMSLRGLLTSLSKNAQHVILQILEKEKQTGLISELAYEKEKNVISSYLKEHSVRENEDIVDGILSSIEALKNNMGMVPATSLPLHGDSDNSEMKEIYKQSPSLSPVVKVTDILKSPTLEQKMCEKGVALPATPGVSKKDAIVIDDSDSEFDQLQDSSANSEKVKVGSKVTEKSRYEDKSNVEEDDDDLLHDPFSLTRPVDRLQDINGNDDRQDSPWFLRLNSNNSDTPTSMSPDANDVLDDPMDVGLADTPNDAKAQRRKREISFVDSGEEMEGFNVHKKRRTKRHTRIESDTNDDSDGIVCSDGWDSPADDEERLLRNVLPSTTEDKYEEKSEPLYDSLSDASGDEGEIRGLGNKNFQPLKEKSFLEPILLSSDDCREEDKDRVKHNLVTSSPVDDNRSPMNDNRSPSNDDKSPVNDDRSPVKGRNDSISGKSIFDIFPKGDLVDTDFMEISSDSVITSPVKKDASGSEITLALENRSLEGNAPTASGSKSTEVRETIKLTPTTVTTVRKALADMSTSVTGAENAPAFKLPSWKSSIENVDDTKVTGTAKDSSMINSSSTNGQLSSEDAIASRKGTVGTSRQTNEDKHVTPSGKLSLAAPNANVKPRENENEVSTKLPPLKNNGTSAEASVNANKHESTGRRTPFPPLPSGGETERENQKQRPPLPPTPGIPTAPLQDKDERVQNIPQVRVAIGSTFSTSTHKQIPVGMAQPMLSLPDLAVQQEYHEDLFVGEILKWQTRWMKSGPNEDVHISLPMTPKQVKNTYRSFDQYMATQLPLLLMDTFAEIAKTWQERGSESNSTFNASLNSTENPNSNCKYHIYRCTIVDDSTSQIPLSNDLVMLACQVEEGVMTEIFAFVEMVEREQIPQGLLQNEELLKGNNLKMFSLTLKAMSPILVNYRPVPIRGVIVTSLVSAIRKWNGLLRMPRCLLAQDILCPFRAHVFEMKAYNFKDLKHFNKFQVKAIEAVRNAMKCSYATPRVCLLQGPPGTGKTHTLKEIIKCILLDLNEASGKGDKPRILVCAPSNAAVDEISRRLFQDPPLIKPRGDQAAQGEEKRNRYNNCGDFNLVRIGKESKMHHQTKRHSFQFFVQKEMSKRSYIFDNNQFEALRKKLVDELKALDKTCSQLKMSTDLDKRKELNEKMKERVEKQRKYEFLVKSNRKKQSRKEVENQIKQDVLMYANIICCTLSGAGSRDMINIMKRGTIPFSCVIIDEAGQCCEPEALIPLQYGASKLILVGDHAQLPATVLSRRAASYGYGTSLFERIFSSLLETCKIRCPLMLEHQYRMHEDICSFPSKRFYEGRLQTAVQVKQRRQPECIRPYVVLDIKEGQEVSDHRGSIHNPVERGYAVYLCEQLKKTNTFRLEDIGIISPYRKQVNLLKGDLDAKRMNAVEVDSIDGFQGREKNCIILTCVRARLHNESVGFLQNPQRLNVALTRARRCLIILLHANSLKIDEDWCALLDDARKRKLLYSIKSEDEASRAFFTQINLQGPRIQTSPQSGSLPSSSTHTSKSQSPHNTSGIMHHPVYSGEPQTSPNSASLTNKEVLPSDPRTLRCNDTSEMHHPVYSGGHQKSPNTASSANKEVFPSDPRTLRYNDTGSHKTSPGSEITSTTSLASFPPASHSFHITDNPSLPTSAAEEEQNTYGNKNSASARRKDTPISHAEGRRGMEVDHIQQKRPTRFPNPSLSWLTTRQSKHESNDNKKTRNRGNSYQHDKQASVENRLDDVIKRVGRRLSARKRTQLVQFSNTGWPAHGGTRSRRGRGYSYK